MLSPRPVLTTPSKGPHADLGRRILIAWNGSREAARALEKKLKAAGIELSATEALGALKTIRVVDIDLGNGETKRCVTPGSERATRILAALGITDRNPPAPPKQDQTLM